MYQGRRTHIVNPKEEEHTFYKTKLMLATTFGVSRVSWWQGLGVEGCWGFGMRLLGVGFWVLRCGMKDEGGWKGSFLILVITKDESDLRGN